MDIEQAKNDFKEICDKLQDFVKKYGWDEHTIMLITNTEIKIMGTQLFKKFEEE